MEVERSLSELLFCRRKGFLSFRSEQCRATVSREHATEFLLRSPGQLLGGEGAGGSGLVFRVIDKLRKCLPSFWPASGVGSLVTKNQNPT